MEKRRARRKWGKNKRRKIKEIAGERREKNKNIIGRWTEQLQNWMLKKKQKAAGDEEVKERKRSLIEWNEKSATRKKSRKIPNFRLFGKLKE